MRNATRLSFAPCLFVAAFLGCGGRALPAGAGGARGGTSGNAGGGTGGGIVGPAGSGGQGTAGTGGAAGVAAACSGATDARLVVADQRILRLTMNETLNTVRYLFDETEAAALVQAGLIGGADDSVASRRRFPPLEESPIREMSYTQLSAIADHVASYVLANFATVTACTTATDACAAAYLDKLAPRAFRRQLTSDERTRFTALYNKLRNSQTVNGYQVTFTVEEATSYAVNALLSSPQMLWRWELGNPAMTSNSPAGVPLTDPELATHLAFFLTDHPPDDMLLAAANAGTLRANLVVHVERLLATQGAKDWLRTIVETYFQINQVSEAGVDPNMFPIFTPSLASDMGLEARKFLDNALWNANLTDLLLSRTAFVNSNLALNVYNVPIPAGATATNFVQTTLPDGQRSGLLTNAAFLTTHASADGRGLLVRHGLLVASALLCMPYPGPDTFGQLDNQTAQQQVATRAAQAACGGCHSQFDPYGLALENYDNLGRYRTADYLNRPVDAHATLPAAIGGGAVANGVELAQALATKPAFTNCMAKVLLQYAMADPAAGVEVPLLPQQAGCATADAVQRYQSANGKTFADLVRATTATPAFLLRRTAP